MKIARKKGPALPGLMGPVRVDGDSSHLLRRVKAGDIVVIDHPDLDRATAQALAHADVAAVVNLSPMTTGRFPNPGPQVLTDAGVMVLESGQRDLLALKDGTAVRLHEQRLLVGDLPVASVVELDAAEVVRQEGAARAGMLNQLTTFAHHTTEFLQHEDALLLHGAGLPTLRTTMKGRPVVVVGPGAQGKAELAQIKRFVAEQKPVMIGVDGGAALIRAAGHPVHVAVLTTSEPESAASAKDHRAALAQAKDVLVRVSGTAAPGLLESFERSGLHVEQVATEATVEDVALLVALAGEPSVVVATGLDASLEEFLDSNRGGLASTFLTRLTLGSRLVDAAVVPALYSGRVRGTHLLWLLLAGLLAIAAALSVTPLGEQWAHDLWAWLQTSFDSIQGKLS